MRLSEINDGLARLIVTYGTELGPLSDEALDRRPPDGGWSAREVVGHLVRTVELYNAAFAHLIEKAGARASEGTPGDDAPRATLVGRLLLGLLRKEADQQKKVSAPKVFKPETERAYDVPGLVAAHEALLGHGREIASRNLGARKIATPVSGLLRLRAHEALEVQLRHGHRHLAQALRAAAD